MEILATKIAELMDITVEAAIKLLPVIQYEYIWYKVGELLRCSIMILFVFLLIAFAIALFDLDFCSLDYEEQKKITSIFNKILFTVSLTIPLWIVGYVLQLFMSPTIMMIKDFIK